MKIKSYLDYKTVEKMDDQTLLVFMNLALMEEENVPFPNELKDTLTYKIIISRLEAFSKARSTDHCALFLSSISRTPGEAVIWAYTIADIYYKIKDGKDNVRMFDIAELFPNGFPTEDTYVECWKNQKKNGPNGLDQIENWDGPKNG